MKKRENRNLKYLRSKLKLTQAAFAKKLSITAKKLSDIEKEIKEVEPGIKEKLYKTYNISEKNLGIPQSEFQKKLQGLLNKKKTKPKEETKKTETLEEKPKETSNKKVVKKKPIKKKVVKKKAITKIDDTTQTIVNKPSKRNKTNISNKSFAKPAQDEIQFFYSQQERVFVINKKNEKIEISHEKTVPWIRLNKKIVTKDITQGISRSLFLKIWISFITILLLVMLRLNLMEVLTYKTFTFSLDRVSIFFFGSKDVITNNIGETFKNIFSSPIVLISISLFIFVTLFITCSIIMIFNTKTYKKFILKRRIRILNIFRHDYYNDPALKKEFIKEDNGLVYYTLQIKETYLKIKRYTTKNNLVVKEYPPIHYPNINYILTSKIDNKQHFISWKNKQINLVLPEEVNNLLCEQLLKRFLFQEIKI